MTARRVRAKPQCRTQRDVLGHRLAVHEQPAAAHLQSVQLDLHLFSQDDAERSRGSTFSFEAKRPEFECADAGEPKLFQPHSPRRAPRPDSQASRRAPGARIAGHARLNAAPLKVADDELAAEQRLQIDTSPAFIHRQGPASTGVAAVDPELSHLNLAGPEGPRRGPLDVQPLGMPAKETRHAQQEVGRKQVEEQIQPREKREAKEKALSPDPRGSLLI